MAIDPNNLSGTATLTFADEFNTLSLWNGTSGTWSTNLWWGWENGHTVASNGDQEWYIDANYGPTASVKPWSVSNGVLSITVAKTDPAIKPYINNYEYTSGSLNSSPSYAQTYGYFEMSAQLPKGQGFCPAFWLLPATNSWPPEIDIMEVLGKDMTSLYSFLHTS